MSADRLREAARVLREKAVAATSGATLNRYKHGGGRLAVFDGDRRLVADFFQVDDREFFALWSPSVALALADWLETDADFSEQLRMSCEKEALRIADLILGGAS